MYKIMIIEDDIVLRKQIADYLKKYGYFVIELESFFDIEERFVKEEPDIVLLDINLPYYDGNYYCKRFRKISNAPIMIISARNSNSDQILSMELGADDYIIKPFNINVLVTKVNAMVRRVNGEYSNNETIKNIKGLALDNKGFKMSYKDKNEELSKNEYKLLSKFIDNYNAVLSREVLLSELWDDSNFIDDNTLTVNISRLKGKLSAMGLNNIIKTKRGAGYILDITAIDEKEGDNN